MICTPNDCSTIRGFLFLGLSCMQAKIGELWVQTHFAVSFLYAILCAITHTTKKLKDVVPMERLLYYQRYLFSELRAICKIQYY